MKTIVALAVAVFLLLSGAKTFAGDLTCYGYTSTTSHFACGTHGNCVWWAAYKRPDIAAVISGGGWNGNQWHGNLSNEGFDVGLVPKIGAIAAFSNDPVGHVAYVESVDSDGSFGVSEMDYYGTLGSGNGVQYSTYSPNGSTYKRNGSGTWILQGFIYRKQSEASSYCDSINSLWGICWTPSSTDVSCHGGTDRTLYDFEQGDVIRVSTDEYCLESGGVGGGLVPVLGPGGEITATDPAIPQKPDFIVTKMWLVDSSGAERYKFAINEAFDTKAQSKNIGEGSCAVGEPDTITGHFYLSKGYKEDPHSGDGAWRRLDSTTTQCSSLEPGETNTETKNTVISEWITEPGIYNIVYCIDHPQDDHNNGGDHLEEHESNNCSTEAAFEVIPTNHMPTGNLESLNCTSAIGWAKDQDATDPSDVHVYKSDISGNNAVFIASMTADVYRSDVGGNYGFSWLTLASIKDGGAYKLSFYVINTPEGNNPLIGQKNISCAAVVNNLYPVYRFSGADQSHFYTISESEKNGIINSTSWNIEGVKFYAYATQQAGTTPVYRFSGPGEHFFTASTTEKNTLMGMSGWSYEGIAFYAYATQASGTVPVYRLSKGNITDHLYTVSITEKNSAITNGYGYEGIAWYVYLTPPN